MHYENATEIRLRGGACGGEVVVAEGEPPSVALAVPGGQVEYVRTRQHDAEGRRVYAPKGGPSMDNETLGWTTAPGVAVASKPCPVGGSGPAGGWEVAVAANGHRIVTGFSALTFSQGRHFALLDHAAARVLRAVYHRPHVHRHRA